MSGPFGCGGFLFRSVAWTTNSNPAR
eukprot:COSAG02_NODE_50369_length_321_cov_0.490991_1_plen_25_part_01